MAALPDEAEPLRARYLDAGRAASYAGRSRARHEAELRVVARAVGRLPAALRLLDVPAGTGRLGAWLEARGHTVVSADVSSAMLTAAGQPRRPLVADAFRLPFADRVFDAVCSLRFLHHLDGPAARARLLAECARVTRRFVLLSLRHPLSLHAAARRLRALLRGQLAETRATTVGRLAREAARHGLDLRAADAQARFRREFWLVTFEKSGGRAGPPAPVRGRD